MGSCRRHQQRHRPADAIAREPEAAEDAQARIPIERGTPLADLIGAVGYLASLVDAAVTSQTQLVDGDCSLSTTHG